jgi:hypothetical protein
MGVNPAGRRFFPDSLFDETPPPKTDSPRPYLAVQMSGQEIHDRLIAAAENNEVNVIHEILNHADHRISSCTLGQAMRAAENSRSHAALAQLNQYSSTLPDSGLHHCMQYYGKNKQRIDLYATVVGVATIMISTFAGIVGLTMRYGKQ